MTAKDLRLPELPVNACLDELSSALQSGHVILSAATGSGKTTVAPLSLLHAPWLAGKKIIMLEPRRPAARMAAHRMAWLLGETTGQTVGYQVRFERKISPRTRIEVLTEGLLLKRLQADPELADVGLVIFDEFHERNLVADLSLALCIDVCQSLRDDLHLLVMSASLDTDRLASLLHARNITAEGKLFPVTVHYADNDLPLTESVDACLPLIGKALDTVQTDVLVFLPGRGEIERLMTLAKQQWGDRCEVLALYGDLGTVQQDRVLNPAQHPDHQMHRRLILSTDIAETSLTIEGIEAVVDSGRARRPVFQPNSGLTRLETRWISKASALQRSGRAGRLRPGHCFRAWTQSRQQRLDDWITPEILQADLADTVLELATWGVSDPATVTWLDAPPKGHWQQARNLLLQLQAIDGQGKITGQGREMSTLPMHPRLAHMLLNATGRQGKHLAADIAALLSDRDPFIRQRDASLPVDLCLRLTALNDWRERNAADGCDRHRLRQLDRLSKQFLQMTAAMHDDGSVEDGRTDQADEVLSVGACLAMAYPDRVAKRRASDGSYLMRNGRGVMLPRDDSLVTAETLVIANLDAGHRDGRAWLAAAIDRAEIERLFAAQIQHQRSTYWDEKHRKVVARETSTLGRISLTEQQCQLKADDPVTDILLAQVKQQGLALFGEQKAMEALRARVQTMHRLEGQGDGQGDGQGGWPDVSETALLQNLDEWLLPWLDRADSLQQLRQVDLYAAIQSWLGWEKQRRLDKLLPETWTTPAATRRKISYDLNDPPVLEVPLQEMLGVSESPAVAGNRLKLVVHLLSPAGRPLQVTQDLPAFWQGAYQEVKKEMRGRYPKHYWPDDPASAEATRFTKKRMQKQKK